MTVGGGEHLRRARGAARSFPAPGGWLAAGVCRVPLIAYVPLPDDDSSFSLRTRPRMRPSRRDGPPSAAPCWWLRLALPRRGPPPVSRRPAPSMASSGATSAPPTWAAGWPTSRECPATRGSCTWAPPRAACGRPTNGGHHLEAALRQAGGGFHRRHGHSSPATPTSIYVGTGESNVRNSVSFGNGVYKSTDGGRQLEAPRASRDTERISRVVVSPHDPQTRLRGRPRPRFRAQPRARAST